MLPSECVKTLSEVGVHALPRTGSSSPHWITRNRASRVRVHPGPLSLSTRAPPDRAASESESDSAYRDPGSRETRVETRAAGLRGASHDASRGRAIARKDPEGRRKREPLQTRPDSGPLHHVHSTRVSGEGRTLRLCHRLPRRHTRAPVDMPVTRISIESPRSPGPD